MSFYRESMFYHSQAVVCFALARNDGNQCATARELGLHRNTFSRIVDKLGLKGHEALRKRGGLKGRAYMGGGRSKN